MFALRAGRQVARFQGRAIGELRAYSSFTFKEIVVPMPPRSWDSGAPSGEKLVGPSQKLFKQLSAFEDSREMAG